MDCGCVAQERSFLAKEEKIEMLKEYKAPSLPQRRHILFLLCGLILMTVGMLMDYRFLRKMAKPLLLLGILSLIIVLIPAIGKESYGARRWFKIGMFNVQPSEIVKIIMLIYVADFLARKQNKLKNR